MFPVIIYDEKLFSHKKITEMTFIWIQVRSSKPEKLVWTPRSLAHFLHEGIFAMSRVSSPTNFYLNDRFHYWTKCTPVPLTLILWKIAITMETVSTYAKRDNCQA